MQNILKNYRSTIFLLCSVLIGSILGLIFKEKALIVKPLGDLFLNFLLVIVVPLIFFTISSSISKMQQPKRLRKILGSIVVVFVITSVIAVLFGFLVTSVFDLVETGDAQTIKEVFSDVSENKDDLNLLERTVSAVSVSDFYLLLTKDNMIALIVISIFFGIAVNKSGVKGQKVKELLDSFSEVMMKLIDVIMIYAPIGLGCFFASLIGTIGSSIAIGYFKTFVIYLLVSLIFYFGIYSLYAYIAGGKKAFKSFWKHILPATMTSLGTCSSAASMPVNIDCTKKMGVSDDIAKTTISLGTSFHKDGSCLGSVFKIMFLVSLFGTSLNSMGSILEVLGISLIATLLVTAVPIGGGTISELLILSLMNYPLEALPILTIIATIIDAPATLLNVVGDSTGAMLVSKMVDGKNWINKTVEN